MRGFRWRGPALAVVVTIGIGASPVPAAAPVQNGGFETGDTKGWKRTDQGEAFGWRAYSGTTTPISGNTVREPPRGSFAAISDQTGPGAHLLLKSVKLPPGKRHVLKFLVYWNNYGGAWVNGPGLDPGPDAMSSSGFPGFYGGGEGEPNQQFRVDVLAPKRNVWTTDPDKILATVFRTRPGMLLFREKPKRIRYDLSRFAGRSVRIRFAEVDNLNFLNVGIDQVRIAG